MNGQKRGIVNAAFVERRESLGPWVPGIALLRRHRRAALRRDIVAGVVLAALLGPQGMAYAELGGVSPVTGLYATLVPLFVYFLLGPSRILVLGPDSTQVTSQSLSFAKGRFPARSANRQPIATSRQWGSG